MVRLSELIPIEIIFQKLKKGNLKEVLVGKRNLININETFLFLDELSMWLLVSEMESHMLFWRC